MALEALSALSAVVAVVAAASAASRAERISWFKSDKKVFYGVYLGGFVERSC